MIVVSSEDETKRNQSTHMSSFEFEGLFIMIMRLQISVLSTVLSLDLLIVRNKLRDSSTNNDTCILICLIVTLDNSALSNNNGTWPMFSKPLSFRFLTARCT